MVLGEYTDSDLAEIASIMPYGQARIPVHTTAF